jgi:hypothetical protein
VRTERHVLFRGKCLARKRKYTVLQEQAINFLPLIVT